MKSKKGPETLFRKTPSRGRRPLSSRTGVASWARTRRRRAIRSSGAVESTPTCVPPWFPHGAFPGPLRRVSWRTCSWCTSCRKYLTGMLVLDPRVRQREGQFVRQETIARGTGTFESAPSPRHVPDWSHWLRDHVWTDSGRQRQFMSSAAAIPRRQTREMTRQGAPKSFATGCQDDSYLSRIGGHRSFYARNSKSSATSLPRYSTRPRV